MYANATDEERKGLLEVGCFFVVVGYGVPLYGKRKVFLQCSGCAQRTTKTRVDLKNVNVITIVVSTSTSAHIRWQCFVLRQRYMLSILGVHRLRCLLLQWQLQLQLQWQWHPGWVVGALLPRMVHCGDRQRQQHGILGC